MIYIYISKPLHIFLTRGVGTRKTFTSMCIIQNMLKYYIKNRTNSNPLKPKIMKLAYIGKVTLNINGMTIHFTSVIPLNKLYNKLKTLSDGKMII